MITVLIPTKDRPSKLAVTLLGLYFQTFNGEWEVFVRDEGLVSVMEDREVRQAWDLLSSRVPCIHFRIKVPTGLVVGRRDLMSRVSDKSEFILWVDDDIVMTANALERFQATYKPGDGFTVPTILDLDNARKHVDYDYRKLPYDQLLALGPSMHYVQCETAHKIRVWRGNNGCMFVPRSVAQNVAKYDFERVTTGEAEDMIASVRMADKFPCYLDTGIVAHHFVDPTHQWSWAKVAGSLVREFLRKEVSQDTFDRAGLATAGYKKV